MGIFVRNGHLAAERVGQTTAYMVVVVGVGAQQVHHLGDSCLQGDVVATNHTDAAQVATGFVLVQNDGTCLALGDIENDDVALDGIFQGMDKPRFGGRIAGAKSLDNHAMQVFGVQNGIYSIGGDAGE